MAGALFYQGPDIEITAGQPTRFRFEFDEILSEAQRYAIAAANYSAGLAGELRPMGGAMGGAIYDFVFTPWGVEMSQNIAEAVEAKARQVGAQIKEYTIEPIAAAAPGVGFTLFGLTWPILLGLVLVLGITREVKR